MLPDVTTLLSRHAAGDASAHGELVERIYPELKRLAARRLAGGPDRGRFQTTDLVHETYLQLIDQRRTDWRNRAHFFAIVARLMRRVLLETARSDQRQKRGGGAVHRSLDGVTVEADGLEIESLVVSQAVERLRAIDPRAAELVELRFFAGLNVEQIAETLGIGRATVTRSWRFARSWLRLHLADSTQDSGVSRMAECPAEDAASGDGATR